MRLSFDNSKPYPGAFLNKEKAYPLQNTRDPQREAERLCHHWKLVPGKTRIICLLGISSMYILVEILRVMDENSILIVVEPDVDFQKEFEKHNDLSILEDFPAEIKFLSDEDPILLALQFRQTLRQQLGYCEGLLSTPPVTRLRPELELMRDKLKAQIRLEAMDRLTVIAFADEWIQNCIINLPEILQAPTISQLKDKFKKSDAMVLCAGPSLTDSLEIIKEKQEECLVIAVGTALKPALAAGITPDITIIVDSAPVIYEQFDTIESPQPWLVCKYTVFPGLIQKYGGNLISFNSLVTEEFSSWLAEGGFVYSDLKVGGTVSLSAVDCAIYLGCRNIFVYGLDLAYGEDGTSHAKNSVYDGNKQTNGLVKVKGNRTAEVVTTRQFANYVHIMNRYFRDTFSHFTGKIFNVNNAGAFMNCVTLISPEEIKENFQSSDDNIQEILRQPVSENNYQEITAHLQNGIDELNSIRDEAREILSRTEESPIPEGISEFEERVKNSRITNCLLGSALQAWCVDVTTQNTRNAEELTSDFLKQVAGASDWVSGLLQKSLERFLKQTQKGVRYGA